MELSPGNFHSKASGYERKERVKKSTPASIGFLTLLLSACSNLSEVPTTGAASELLNVVKVAGRWLVKGGDKKAALLWRSQNPVGKSVTVRFAGSSSPTELTLTGGHASVGDMLIGNIRDGQVIGAQGWVQVCPSLRATGSRSKSELRAIPTAFYGTARVKDLPT